MFHELASVDTRIMEIPPAPTSLPYLYLLKACRNLEHHYRKKQGKDQELGFVNVIVYYSIVQISISTCCSNNALTFFRHCSRCRFLSPSAHQLSFRLSGHYRLCSLLWYWWLLQMNWNINTCISIKFYHIQIIINKLTAPGAAGSWPRPLPLDLALARPVILMPLHNAWTYSKSNCCTQVKL